MKTEKQISAELDEISDQAQWDYDHRCTLCDRSHCAGYCQDYEAQE